MESISTHDLTKRSTLAAFPEFTVINYFNSRPHEEVDALSDRIWLSLSYFNSRPHEEVDDKKGVSMSDIDISTHDLTKRSTMEQYQKSFIMEHFNSRPHEEVDQLKEPFPQEDQLFQLTTSRRGRLEGLRNSFNSWFISTHDLTKRSTRRSRSKIWFDIISTHDLTKRSTL